MATKSLTARCSMPMLRRFRALRSQSLSFSEPN
jgi:hypothetical protein